MNNSTVGTLGQSPESSQVEMPEAFRKLRDAAPSADEKVAATTAKAMENYRAGSEANLRAEELKQQRREGRRTSGAALIEGGLTLLTDLDLQPLDSQSWLVKNVIPETGFGVMYGDSGTFKSFGALDLLAAIANGADTWFGYRVKRAPCVYIPFEGKGGIAKRVAAWRLAMSMRTARPNTGDLGQSIDFSITTGVVFITEALNLRNEEDRKKLIATLKAARFAGGVLCIDTLAQAGAGIDENSSEGMGEMIRIFQELQRALGGVVLVIHHTGKTLSAGMRGHSSLRAALDFAIEFSKPETYGKYEAVMTLDKVKDEESGATIPFSMQRVTLGVDDDGDFVTSLVMQYNEPNPNMPEVIAPSEEQVNANVDAFVWNWIKREVAERKRPSVRSLTAKLNEMQRHYQGVLKRDHIRDAVERLVSARRITKEKHNGNQWLCAQDPVPPAPWERKQNVTEGAPGAHGGAVGGAVPP